MSSNNWNTLKASEFVQRSHNDLRKFVENEAKVLIDHPKQPLLKFSVGDPCVYKNFKPYPEVLQAAAKQAYHYWIKPSPKGEITVRKFLANTYTYENNPLDESRVFITEGCSNALGLALNVLCDEGDNILVPSPSFPLMNPHQNWQIDIQDIKNKINNKTKAILVNNPSNPLGSVASEDILKEIIQIAEERNIPIIADEVYEHMVNQNHKFYSLAQFSSKIPILVCSAISKRYLVPGWRGGWLLVYGQNQTVEDIITGINHLCHQVRSPSKIIQLAILDIITNAQQTCIEISTKIHQRYEVLKSHLENMKGIIVNDVAGAMYGTIVFDLSYFKDIQNDKQLSIKLLEEENVFAIPGTIFGGSNFLRLVMCADQEDFSIFAERLKSFCEKHYK